MGWFFGSSSKTLKLSDIEKIMRGVPSLDYKEKERVMGAFSTVDDNGISKEEFRKVVYELYEAHKISETDYNGLKRFWKALF